MKTLFTFALALSINIMSFASPTKESLATRSGVSYSYQTVKITLLNGIGKVKISVLDAKGMNLFTDYIKIKEDVVYPINMSNVPDGKYLIRISNKEEVSEHWVDIKAKELTYQAADAAIEVIDDQKIKVLVKGITGEMTLKMFNSDHRLLVKDKIKGKRSYSKNYKLENLSVDNVYFTLTDSKGHQQFIHR